MTPSAPALNAGHGKNSFSLLAECKTCERTVRQLGTPSGSAAPSPTPSEHNFSPIRVASYGALIITANFDSVLVAVVIVVIPISLGMPAMCVFIPPSMMCVPAALPRFM